MNIGLKIRELRSKKNMSSGKLGELIGKTRQQVDNYENGKSKITTDVLNNIATVLGVDVSELMANQTGINEVGLEAENALLRSEVDRLRKKVDELKDEIITLLKNK